MASFSEELFDSAPRVRDTSFSARTNRSPRGVQRDDVHRTGTSCGRTGPALLNSAANPHGRSSLELGSNEFSRGATRTSLARCNSSSDSGRTAITPWGTGGFRDGDAELLSMVSNDGLAVVRETKRKQIDAEKSSTDGTEMAETSPESEEEEGEHDNDEHVGHREARRVQDAVGVMAGGVGKFGASEGAGEAQGNGEAPTSSRGKRPACDGTCDASADAHRIKVIRVEPCRRGKGSLPELMKKLKTNRKDRAPSPPPAPKESQAYGYARCDAWCPRSWTLPDAPGRSRDVFDDPDTALREAVVPGCGRRRLGRLGLGAGKPSVCACQEPGWLLRQWRDVRIPPLRTLVNSAPRKGVRVANRLSDIMVPDYDQLLALMPDNIFDCMSPQNNASSNVAGAEAEDLLDFSDSGDGWPSIDDGLQQQPSHA